MSQKPGGERDLALLFGSCHVVHLYLQSMDVTISSKSDFHFKLLRLFDLNEALKCRIRLKHCEEPIKGKQWLVYLSNQKAVITRQWHRDRGHADISRLSICDSLEATPHEALHPETVHILEPHQALGGPLEVFQFGQFSLFLLVTGPEGWTAEGQKVSVGVGW